MLNSEGDEMLTKQKTGVLLSALLLAVSAASGAAADAAPKPKAITAAPKPKAVTAAPSPAVRDVAGNPAAHLGRLSLVGVVGIATPHKGFVLMDMQEYQGEGLACLTTPERTKIPVIWSGAAPKVKQTVRVDGTLAKTVRGYAFTADKVKP